MPRDVGEEHDLAHAAAYSACWPPETKQTHKIFRHRLWYEEHRRVYHEIRLPKPLRQAAFSCCNLHEWFYDKPDRAMDEVRLFREAFADALNRRALEVQKLVPEPQRQLRWFRSLRDQQSIIAQYIRDNHGDSGLWRAWLSRYFSPRTERMDLTPPYPDAFEDTTITAFRAKLESDESQGVPAPGEDYDE